MLVCLSCIDDTKGTVLQSASLLLLLLLLYSLCYAAIEVTVCNQLFLVVVSELYGQVYLCNNSSLLDAYSNIM